MLLQLLQLLLVWCLRGASWALVVSAVVVVVGFAVTRLLRLLSPQRCADEPPVFARAVLDLRDVLWDKGGTSIALVASLWFAAVCLHPVWRIAQGSTHVPLVMSLIAATCAVSCVASPMGRHSSRWLRNSIHQSILACAVPGACHAVWSGCSCLVATAMLLLFAAISAPSIVAFSIAGFVIASTGIHGAVHLVAMAPISSILLCALFGCLVAARAISLVSKMSSVGISNHQG